MIQLDNQTNIEIDISLLETITTDNTDKDVELLFIHSDEMQEINKEYRGKDSTTDVLSFPLDEMPYAPLGSIIINVDLSKEKAEEFGHTFQDEISLLYIHGLLHLLGYDHEVDEGEMRIKEEEFINHYKLPTSLIIRTEG